MCIVSACLCLDAIIISSARSHDYGRHGGSHGGNYDDTEDYEPAGAQGWSYQHAYVEDEDYEQEDDTDSDDDEDEEEDEDNVNEDVSRGEAN